MDKSTELLCKLQDPALRRVWLLYKALECVPLDRAIDLAGMADQFVLGSPSEAQSERPHPAHPISASSSQPHTALGSPTRAPSETARRSNLPLSPELRRRLLDRLATGARNAELAVEFRLTARQVQGIRISQARITKLRWGQEKSPRQQPESIDEVVRFLRQQDDVVVRQDNGEFLVNGRFRLQPADLLERANRMRERQGKPRFTQGTPEPEAEQSPHGQGDPSFWNDAPIDGRAQPCPEP